MRKRRIKKAGKKLDAEVKAVVWPELHTVDRRSGQVAVFLCIAAEANDTGLIG